jgi:D-sedoheptulose 7-phosphate isomerase
MEFITLYLEQTAKIARSISPADIQNLVDEFVRVRDAEGRVFFLGVGGSAANASHAVNDFRKIVGLECYAPSDNVAEITARTNDDGWRSTYAGWLEVSRVGPTDLVFVFSVGGGSETPEVSPNIIEALRLARARGARIAAVLGRDGGFTATVADAAVLVPTVDPALVTPHVEAFQAVLWHLIVSHPALKRHETLWERTRAPVAATA